MSNEIKILLVGLESIDKLSVAKSIIAQNDNLSIIPMFTTDESFNNINDNYKYYLNVTEANLAYKNNALFTICTENYISQGITFDDFYNHDISFLNIYDFNNIPDRFFYEFEILVVWLDSSYNKATKKEINEVKFLEERLKNFKYLYFLNEKSEDVANTIVEYLNDIEKRQELLEQNS